MSHNVKEEVGGVFELAEFLGDLCKILEVPDSTTLPELKARIQAMKDRCGLPYEDEEET